MLISVFQRDILALILIIDSNPDLKFSNFRQYSIFKSRFRDTFVSFMIRAGIFDLDFVLENFRLMNGRNYFLEDLVIMRKNDRRGNPILINFILVGDAPQGYAFFMPHARKIIFCTSKGLEKIAALATKFNESNMNQPSATAVPIKTGLILS